MLKMDGESLRPNRARMPGEPPQEDHRIGSAAVNV